MPVQQGRRSPGGGPHERVGGPLEVPAGYSSGQAPLYDLYSLAAVPLRAGAMRALEPQPGEVVLEVGCGTGLNFEAIQAGIGPQGRIVGVDASAEMLARARDRVARHGWRNVTLVCARVEEAELPTYVDRVLLCMVHDVLRSEPALRRVLGALRPGGRVVAAGAKFVSSPSWWAPMLDGLTRAVNAPCVSSFDGFRCPWRTLAGLVPGLRVQVDPWDVTYLASGDTPRGVLG